MIGERRARVAALVVAVLLASTTLLLGGPAAGQPGQAGDCDPGDTGTTVPECTSTTPSTTSTTLATTTSTSTTVIQTTSTQRQVVTTAEAAGTTSTSIDVTTSQNLLVPGDGTEGAESTTTTTQTPTRISSDGTSDGALLAIIVGGLVLLALAVSILTWRYWVATRPSHTTTVGSDHG